MIRKSWQEVPNELVDQAEELLRIILEDPELSFSIQGGTCTGFSTKVDLAISSEVAHDFNWLSERGLIACLNYMVFHPENWALCRTPDTGESDGFLLSDEPWEYHPVILKEELEKTDKAGLHIEGWNVPFGDC